jgi:DNA-binding NtrC family response regulator
LVKEEAFRKDLFFRLHTHHIHIPPLRERIDDLPILLKYFIRMAAEEFEKEIPSFGTELIQHLENYPFPGNVRELKSMVIDAVGRNQSEKLPVHLFTTVTGNGQQDSADNSYPDRPDLDANHGGWLSRLAKLPTLKELTTAVIAEAMHRSNNNQRQAAQMLGMTPQALNQRLKRSSLSAD